MRSGQGCSDDPVRRYTQGFNKQRVKLALGEIEPQSISIPNIHAGTYQTTCNGFWRVVVAGRDTDQANTDALAKSIDKLISPAALWPSVGTIVQFNSSQNARGPGTTENEIDVLLGNAIGTAPFPIVIGTGDEIRQANLAGDKVAVSEQAPQGA